MNGARMQLVELPSLALSTAYQNRLAKVWDERVSDDLAFVPTDELKRGVSVRECIEQNTRLGAFATDYLREAFAVRHAEGRTGSGPGADKKKIVAVGYGRGYDSDWLKSAFDAGLETWWVDVSKRACEFALQGMEKQFASLFYQGRNHGFPVIKQAEIRSLLADPHAAGLSLESVELWYLCRVLGCLSERSAKIVLKHLGRSLSSEYDPGKHNGIIIIAALREDNPAVIGNRSRLPTQRILLSNARSGAQRPVKIVQRKQCRYFQKVVTALTLTAA